VRGASTCRIDRKLEASQLVARMSAITTTVRGASMCRTSLEFRASGHDAPVSATVHDTSARRTFPEFRASRLDAPTRKTRRRLGLRLHETEL
jgi:hypothetical protein